MKKNFESEIFLPSFQGFYESIWTPDWEMISIDHEERGITLTDDWEIDEQYFTDLAREYVAYLQEVYRNDLGVDITLEFTELVRPREYNFTTDKIFCKLHCNDVKKFTERINTLIAENYDAVGEYIKENHSSYSGFISFMSADVNDWLDEWLEDDRQLSYLLYYLVEILRNERGELESLDSELYYPIHESVDSCYYAYPATDKAKEELKAVELREAQEEAMRKYQLKLPLEF